MRRLEGNASIITGAGQNIGRAMSELFASEGSAVAVCDIDGGRARAVADGIVASGGRAVAVVADVTDEGAVSEMVGRVVEELGRVDVLVNNVALTVNKPMLETSLEDWERCFAVTLRSQFLCTQAVARHMIDAGHGGAIVNVGSTSGLRGRFNAFAYAVAKAGVYNLTRAAAVELAPHGIRVNTLTPTQTGSPVGVADDAYSPDRSAPPKGIPIGRFGEPIDQARAALFLASDEAAFITGADLACDGGLLAVFPRAF